MFAFIADVHISSKLNPSDYLNSLSVFLKHIKESKEECHAIFVLGDVFDHRLDIAESKLAAEWLQRITCNYCGKSQTHVPCYFIHGTFSHDLDQYDIFLPNLSKIENVYVYYTNQACEMTLTSGHKVLMLPQEYNKEYSEWFNNKYDIIIGHGVVTSFTKAPCQTKQGDYNFQTEVLSKHSNICVFGHFHEYTDFGDNVFYAGSMLRAKYNEDTPKQFLFCNDKYETHTIPNPCATEFKTIKINNPEELREIISTDIKTPHRFIINYDESYIEEYSAIMSVNKNNKNITYKVESNNTNNSELSNTDDIIQIDKRTTIVNPIPELITFIKETHNTDVEKRINEYVDEINKKEEE